MRSALQIEQEPEVARRIGAHENGLFGTGIQSGAKQLYSKKDNDGVAPSAASSQAKEKESILEKKRDRPLVIKTDLKKESPNLKEVFNKKKPSDNEPEMVQTVEVANAEELNDPVSIDQVSEVLKAYVQKKDPSPTVKMVLSKSISLSDDLKVEFQIFNKIEINALQLIEVDLLEYLRKSLKNSSIGMNFKIIEADSSERRPYTNSEIFQAMAKKNPAILKLMDVLGLDPDY